MVAYNLWMAEPDLARARAIATAIRSPAVRSVAFPVRGEVQVSCNLVDPFAFGPVDIWDQVSYLAPVARAELVGLVPEGVLHAAPKARWAQLDLAPERTIEARLLLSAT
jgi:glutamate formiminotransferase